MGVKKLSSFVSKNIKIPTGKWIIDKNEYNKLSGIKKKIPNNQTYNKSITANSEKISLIVDANAFFYFMSNQLNWFVFDNLELFKLLHKYLLCLLSIENLEKLVFVFDGMDTSMKIDTNISRAKERIKTMSNFYKKIVNSNSNSRRPYFKPNKVCAVPLIRQAYGQFLFDCMEFYEKLEVKFSLFEADADIANIANKYNGYVISNDSDFYIYDTPGYITIDSINFPKNYKDNIDTLKYQLYKTELLSDYLGIPKESLPIFATLCGNDYIKIGKYNNFSNQLGHYSWNHEIANKIKENNYKNVVNFILDICENIDKDEFERSNQKQELIINKLFEMKRKDNNEDECHEDLMNSINEYNLKTLKENQGEGISKEIIESYYSGHIYEVLLNVIYNHHFKCTQYFENLEKKSCWAISDEVRKVCYNLLFRRNIKNMKNPNKNDIQTKYVITEYITKNGTVIADPVNINIDINDVFPDSIEERYKIYLSSFKSNNEVIRRLPYYLIPAVSTLRYYLYEKCNHNLFIPNKNDDIYSKFLNVNSIHLKEEMNYNNEDTILHYYDLQSLVASYVIALTFTYLNYNIYNKNGNSHSMEQINKKMASLSLDSLTIENNIKENKINECSNICDMLINNRNRSLLLKNRWGPKGIQSHREDFDNAVQIYAEVLNLMIWNSHLLEILKFTNEIKDFGLLFTMYHYESEESFYCMIESFKNGNDLLVIFNNLFTAKYVRNNIKSYFNYLKDVYALMLNAILS